jgi:hypothetical protein
MWKVGHIEVWIGCGAVVDRMGYVIALAFHITALSNWFRKSMSARGFRVV